MKLKKLALLLIIVGLVGSYIYFDLGEYLNLGYLKSHHAELVDWYNTNSALAIAVYMGVYIVVTALSLPGAAVMTIAGGAVFGLVTGVIIVSFSSSIGATLAFLVSRYMLRDWVESRFSKQIKAINSGIDKDGAFYLFTLRLIPAFPFFVINLVMGLTRMKVVTFYLVSQLGMLAGTVLYVNVGVQVSKIDSLSGILSPQIIGSFAVLGIFPLITKKIVDYLKATKVLRGYKKPRTFDRNIVVIGAGSGGLVSSYIAAAVNAKVTLIEKHKMGGDCLNTGCVPSKAFIKSARILAQSRRPQDYGFKSAQIDFDFADVMESVQKVVRNVEPHDSVERYTTLGVDVIEGSATIKDPYSVEVNGEVITARNIIVATGGRPYVPDLPGLEEVGYLTSDTVWSIRALPRRLVVMGGGPIGCELAQSFSRFGSQVSIVQRNVHLIPREDTEFSELVEKRFRDEGVALNLGSIVKSVSREEDGTKVVVIESGGKEKRIACDEILVAIGRTPNVTGFGLEELGVSLAPGRPFIEVNEFMQTNIPTIYAVGDVVGPYMFTHMAAHQAWYASVNALFGRFKRFKVDYSVVPWATFTEPEVARVGLNEKEAIESETPYEVTVFGVDELDRAIADREAEGMVKVLTVPGKDDILGVTMAGDHAGDIIAEFVSAMRNGIGLNKVLGTIHIYPTLAESNKYVAGEWKRNHKPESVLGWIKKYHSWRLK